jgi:hypothetical protein
MAKLEGILQLRGTIGNMTFSHTKNGIIVGEKTSIDKTRINTDPAFARTRENMAEFAAAGRAATLVVKALKSSLPAAKDAAHFRRLLKVMRQAISFDTTNLRGLRTVTDGDLSIVEFYEFNGNSSLASVLQAPFTPTVTRATGELEVVVPAFDMLTGVVPPTGATHLKIVATGAELDFANNGYVADVQRSGYLAIVPGATAPVTLTTTVTANSTKPLMLSLGLEFFQEVNGQKYPLKSGLSNCHSIIKIDA